MQTANCHKPGWVDLAASLEVKKWSLAMNFEGSST